MCHARPGYTLGSASGGSLEGAGTSHIQPHVAECATVPWLPCVCQAGPGRTRVSRVRVLGRGTQYTHLLSFPSWPLRPCICMCLPVSAVYVGTVPSPKGGHPSHVARTWPRLDTSSQIPRQEPQGRALLPHAQQLQRPRLGCLAADLGPTVGQKAPVFP